MKTNLNNLITLFIVITVFIGCATQRTSTIVGGEYNEAKNETDYFVFPYGSVKIPGKWEKTKYNSNSRQQYFQNQDSVLIAIALGKIDKYEFNMDGKKVGAEFVKAFYEWDSKYFMDTYGLKRQVLEQDSTKNFMIYRIFGPIEGSKLDTYFLVGEHKGFTSNFSISNTDKWNEIEKVSFLKSLFVTWNE
ncbi:hypothetical protein [Plebeiibacterium sediminum]|uniref:Uncharacterized protein n=1 Tax=Plebeiibacterium sediminum TaxID=2992112 RepID=A0AAE3M295_9BACT|nr:hypothetical protein [Plebeiobacterium sediminum]MCW3785424.1 hypothetical protein [Plebeiobacterium sediminum]